MRTETTTRTIYNFDELSESAKQHAIEAQAETNREDVYYDSVFDAFDQVLRIMGVTVKQIPFTTVGKQTRHRAAFYFRGFWSQGDGASFEGTYKFAPDASKEIRVLTDEQLHRIADDLTEAQKPFDGRLTATIEQGRHGSTYVHSNTMSVDLDLDTDDRIYELEHITLPTTPTDGKTLGDLDSEELKKYAEVGFYAEEAKELMKLRHWIDSSEPLPEEKIESLMRELADWFYAKLEGEYEYQTSEEVAREQLEEGDEEFDEDGDII